MNTTTLLLMRRKTNFMRKHKITYIYVCKNIKDNNGEFVKKKKIKHG